MRELALSLARCGGACAGYGAVLRVVRAVRHDMIRVERSRSCVLVVLVTVGLIFSCPFSVGLVSTAGTHQRSDF